MYNFMIKKLVVTSVEGEKEIPLKKVNVIIGPNNSGKSKFIKELRDYLSGDISNINIISKLDCDFPQKLDDLESSYTISKKIKKDIYGNWVLRVFSNKPYGGLDRNMSLEDYYSRGFHSFDTSWKSQLENIIENAEENETMFFEYLGALFFQYLGTEERLTICKLQKDYGLDSNNSNFLSSCKFKRDILKELEMNVKNLFGRDIYLDILTFGDRIGFRVGENFSYIRGNGEIDEDTVNRLQMESLLDNQGDGIKSYVSTFLALKFPENNILLLDEPEAFLHPPLARQMGEVIADTQADNKQIWIATHSVEVLKGILSKCQDVNVIRITQPEPCKNKIVPLKEELLKRILETPLLRVSRVMEGLFCEKVVITEAESDELIYQEVVEKMSPQSGLYFAHGQNKQTLVDIAKLYKEIGIDYEIIVDFDVIREVSEFRKFLEITSIDEKQKKRLESYASKLREMINNSVDVTGLTSDEAKNKQKSKRDVVYHKCGISFFEAGLQEKIKETLVLLKEEHIHILETGELETLLVPYGIEYKDKKEWISEAINRVVSLNAEDIQEESSLYKLIDGVIRG